MGDFRFVYLIHFNALYLHNNKLMTETIHYDEQQWQIKLNYKT